MGTIWKWIKIIGFFLIGIGGMIFVFAVIEKRNKKRSNINDNIERISQIEHKTDEDLAVLKQLNEQRNQIDRDIQNTQNTYFQKAKELMKKPDAPGPGDAGASSDAMTDAWGGSR